MNKNKALRILKENGYKQTKQREKLLQIFQENNQYLAARQILENFRLEFPSASYNTVYRNLYSLAEIGILEETNLNSEKHFRFHCEANGHHHHFICTTCGDISPIDVCPISQVSDKLPNHVINSHKFEVYGICPSCH